jgi:hypothetical protein
MIVHSLYLCESFYSSMIASNYSFLALGVGYCKIKKKLLGSIFCFCLLCAQKITIIDLEKTLENLT